jgi:hypothetical protein
MVQESRFVERRPLIEPVLELLFADVQPATAVV